MTSTTCSAPVTAASQSVIGDVSGKGVPAALVMGVIHGAVRSSACVDPPPRTSWSPPAEPSCCARRAPSLATPACSGLLRAGDAPALLRQRGHYPPLLVGERGHGIEVTRLDAGGPVLGLLPAGPLRAGPLRRPPGDMLVLYSDGLTEATNAGRRGVRGAPSARAPGDDGNAGPRVHGRRPRRDPCVGELVPGRSGARDALTLVVAKCHPRCPQFRRSLAAGGLRQVRFFDAASSLSGVTLSGSMRTIR